MDLHVKYAEHINKYHIIFMFSLFYEYSNFVYAYICVIYRVTQAKYQIRIIMAAPHEYVNTYSTRRPVKSIFGNLPFLIWWDEQALVSIKIK